MLKGEWKIPWENHHIIEEIRELKGDIGTAIQHTFREENQLADNITNIALEREEKQQFKSFSELPVMARKILNTDKSQVPFLRIKKRADQREHQISFGCLTRRLIVWHIHMYRPMSSLALTKPKLS